MEPLHIVLMGAQGSGKGTQGEYLCARLSIPAISTGALLRKNVADGTQIGKQIKAILDAGHLVADEITQQMIAQRLADSDAARGFILDGYPRNARQLADLDAITTITHVLVLHITDEQAVERITGRRQCANNHIYHVLYNPSKVEGVCDVDGLPLMQRSDDTEDAVKKRLAIYHAETEPLIAIYSSRGIVHEIDAIGSVEDVQHRLLQALGVA